ncbi:hypothetical protein CPT_Sonora_050 [Stenotrophomonas phage Sonora]|nr:hypothetical protein CPT_Sonora_050 [Stenotrophomonas phage Sonora]
MSEAAMWDALRPLLRGLDPVRIESPISPGIPDVNWTCGWIELKYAPRWPPRGGPLRIDHFTTEQRGWLTKRRHSGGNAKLLLKVGESEWLLFDGTVAAVFLGKEPKDRLYELSLARWTRKPKLKELQECLAR